MIYQITEAQRRDMLEALEWAIVALTDSINRESGKPWAKHLIDERATYWSQLYNAKLPQEFFLQDMHARSSG